MILIEASVAPPRLYLVNANSLAKRHAMSHLAGDIHGYGAEVAVITETHLNSGHTNETFSIRGYDLLRRDRDRRPGGGVAVFANRHVTLYVIVNEKQNFSPIHLLSCFSNIMTNILLCHLWCAASSLFSNITRISLARALQALSDPYYQSTCLSLSVCLRIGNFDAKYLGN